MTKILVVDDDAQIRNMFKMWFEPRFTVETSESMNAALAQLRTASYDLIVVDLGLPDGDGRNIVNEFRARGGATPILVLSGRADIDSKVALLHMGSDDYITKPFHFKELEARVHTLLRRPRDVQPNVLTARNITLNLSNARVTKGGSEITLTQKEFALLEFFMRHPDQAFSQDALMQRVWANDSTTSADVVRVYVTRLRKKLESQGEPPLIQSQRGHGYIFCPKGQLETQGRTHD